MTRIILSGLAVAVMLAVVAHVSANAQQSGKRSGARPSHTKDWTNPLPGDPGPPASEPRARILRQQGRPIIDSDTNEGRGRVLDKPSSKLRTDRALQ